MTSSHLNYLLKDPSLESHMPRDQEGRTSTYEFAGDTTEAIIPGASMRQLPCGPAFSPFICNSISLLCSSARPPAARCHSHTHTCPPGTPTPIRAPAPWLQFERLDPALPGGTARRSTSPAGLPAGLLLRSLPAESSPRPVLSDPLRAALGLKGVLRSPLRKEAAPARAVLGLRVSISLREECQGHMAEEDMAAAVSESMWVRGALWG